MDLPGKSAEELDEPVHLSGWNPAWPTLAQALAKQFMQLVGRAARIGQIGRAAVEGMRAKPIVDLMIGVRHEIEQTQLAGRLARLGWCDMGEAGVPGRRHVRRRS